MLILDKLRLSSHTASKILKLDSSKDSKSEDLLYSEFPSYAGGVVLNYSNASTLTAGTWYTLAEFGPAAHGAAIVECRLTEGAFSVIVNARQRQATLSLLNQSRGYNSVSGTVNLTTLRLVSDLGASGLVDNSTNTVRLEALVGSSNISANGLSVSIKHLLAASSLTATNGAFAASPTPDGSTIIEAVQLSLNTNATAYDRGWPVAAWCYGWNGTSSVVSILANGRLCWRNEPLTGFYSSGSGYVDTDAILKVRGTYLIINDGTTDLFRTRCSSNSVVLEHIQNGGSLFIRSRDSDDTSGDLYLNDINGGFVFIGTNSLLGAPAFTTRSSGLRFTLYTAISGSAVDYGMGMESSAMWLSASTTATYIRFYGGTTKLAEFGGVSSSVVFRTYGRQVIANDSSLSSGIWFSDNTGTISGATLIGLLGTGLTTDVGIYKNSQWRLRMNESGESMFSTDSTAPVSGYQLAVKGKVYSLGSSAGLFLANQAAGTITNGFSIYSPASDVLYIDAFNGPATRMMIDSTGFVGINTVAPQGHVHINGRLHLTELAANPAASELTSTTYDYPTDRLGIYMKADKLIVAYVLGDSTVRYKYLVLDNGTDNTWHYTTTAP